MEINHPEGIAAVVLGIIVFFGSIYAVIALNTGWRFGYWIAGASFGGFMVFMSTFWLVTALGPRGQEPVWIPIGAAEETIQSASFEDQEFRSTSEYPGGPWDPAEDAPEVSEAETEGLTSAVQGCLETDPEELTEATPPLADVCALAQTFMPATDDLPRIEGMSVVMVPDFRQIEFNTEEGTLLGQVTVVPITRDPRLAEDPQAGEPVGDPFVVVAYRNPGSLRLPALFAFVFSVALFALHLWGLNRAERRKVSAVTA